MNTRETVLRLAEDAVLRDRSGAYGSPEDSFAVIAKLWDTYLSESKMSSIEITAGDVAMMMLLLKVGRDITSVGVNIDTYADMAGYAACAAEVKMREAKIDEAKNNRSGGEYRECEDNEEGTQY